MPFSDHFFWKKLKHYAVQAGLKTIYTALCLYHAYKRPDTPVWAKTVILGALTYFISPIDIIPDLTPILGYTDDMGMLASALTTVSIYIDDTVKEKADLQIKQWF